MEGKFLKDVQSSHGISFEIRLSYPVQSEKANRYVEFGQITQSDKKLHVLG
jgi:hypothetical protein